MSDTINRNAVLIVSGGMDSCVMAHYYASAGFNMHLLSFDYGQKHVKELTYAEKYIANLRERYGQGSNAITIKHDVIELPISRLSPDSDSALLTETRTRPLLSEAGELVAIMAASRKSAFGNRKLAIQ